ncbi:MAG: hypothetical protein ACE5ID_03060 [Acidobacteriota bacterium]
MRLIRNLAIAAILISWAAAAVPQPSFAGDRSMDRVKDKDRRHADGQRPRKQDRNPEEGLEVTFRRDPFLRPDLLLEGDARPRLRWRRDEPAFPGDSHGSLTALYDATLPAGRLGFMLPRPLTQDDPFTAAAVFIIDAAGFTADPAGFFQISWGLWNSSTTGLERTGTPDNFATDTFELLEFDYFPNVSAFGGPFLSPSVAGMADLQDPLFTLLGAFSNFTFASVQSELPLGAPLLAVMRHRPAEGILAISVFRIISRRNLEPVPGAQVQVPLLALSPRAYLLDAAGLTLWRDGFSGSEPSLRANVIFHGLVVRTGSEARLQRFFPHR